MVGVALLLLVLAVARWWRERRGLALVVLRALIIGALVFVMLNPQSLLPRERTEKPKLAVLLDTSASMSTKDIGSDSRFAAALQALTNSSTMAALGKEFVLDLRSFDREAHPVDLNQLGINSPAGDASDIGRALMSVAGELGETKAQSGILAFGVRNHDALRQGVREFFPGFYGFVP